MNLFCGGDELFDAAKQKLEERLSIAPTYLADHAKQWYRVRGLYESWTDFKTALVNDFTSSAHQLKTSAQLYNRRQALNESVQSYYFDVMRLCTRLNSEMPPNERLLHLVRGLKPLLTQTIIILNPRDCSELLEQGKRAEADAFISRTAGSLSSTEAAITDTSAATQTQNNSRSQSNQPEAAPPYSTPPSNTTCARILHIHLILLILLIHPVVHTTVNSILPTLTTRFIVDKLPMINEIPALVIPTRGVQLTLMSVSVTFLTLVGKKSAMMHSL